MSGTPDPQQLDPMRRKSERAMEFIRRHFELIRGSGERTIDFISKHLGPDNPLGEPLVAIVVVLVVAAFVSLAYSILRNGLFDVLFIMVLLVLVALAVTIVWVATFPGYPRQHRRSAQRVLLVSTLGVFLIAQGVERIGIAREARFILQYVRLKLGAATLGEFIDGATLHGTQEDVDSFEPFEIRSGTLRTVVPGIGQTAVFALHKGLLWALTNYRVLHITGTLRVARPWLRGLIVLAAREVDMTDAKLDIGENTLVIVADHIKATSGATIEAYGGNDGDAPERTEADGRGVPGLPAGTVYLVVLGGVSGHIAVDLRGQRGGPGAPGRDGLDVPLSERPKPEASNGVGEIRVVTARQLIAKRDGYIDPSRAILARQNEIIRECGKGCLFAECTDAPKAGTKGVDAVDLSANEEDGMPGGAGGDAGHLYIYTRPLRRSAVLEHIDFNPKARSLGGRGGTGGRAGRGGPGGVRLAEGPLDPFGICGPGPDGPEGSDGRGGAHGQHGAYGSDEGIPGIGQVEVTTWFGGYVQ